MSLAHLDHVDAKLRRVYGCEAQHGGRAQRDLRDGGMVVHQVHREDLQRRRAGCVPQSIINTMGSCESST